MPELTRQTIANLQGEIEFRRKLARQHTTGEMLLPDYLAKDAHDHILAERINTTTASFKKMAGDGLDFTSFLELGAERGHRSLALCSHLHATGIATDLSFDQLDTTPFFAKQFGLAKLPLRICSDANHLPFRSQAVPFVFCYQFLHHFPGLETILPEIYRVLAGNGTLFFDEEPMGRWLQLHLYTQRKKEYAHSNIGKLWQWLEGFISDAPCDEVDHGVIENHAMQMAEWQRGLRIFESTQVQVRTLGRIRSRVGRHRTLANLPGLLLGGVIHGRCQKQLASSSVPSKNPQDWLICPKHRANTGLEVPLVRVGDTYRCQESGEIYPIINDIPILIEPQLRKEIYPQFG